MNDSQNLKYMQCLKIYELRADISMLDHNQLVLIRSVCTLLDLSSGVPQQDNLSKARMSLQEWIENPGFIKNRIEEQLGIL